MERDERFTRFRYNPPTTAARIEQFEANASFRLPNDYAKFLQWTNGGEGFIGHAYVRFWRLEELVEWNKGYQVAEFAPGLFFFGTDGGDEAFALDMRTSAMPIVKVPFIPMQLEDARFMAATFTDFLDVL